MSRKTKNCFFVSVLKVDDENSRIRIQIRTINQRRGSADPDPDPNQNVKDPQHWFQYPAYGAVRDCTDLLDVCVLLGLLLVHGEEGDGHGTRRHAPHHIRIILRHRLQVGLKIDNNEKRGVSGRRQSLSISLGLWRPRGYLQFERLIFV